MRFTDPIDQGSYLAQVHVDNAIAEHAKKLRPEQQKIRKVDEDGHERMEWEHLDCVDCGEPIEPKRLENARIRCVSCQTDKEKKDKVYARR